MVSVVEPLPIFDFGLGEKNMDKAFWSRFFASSSGRNLQSKIQNLKFLVVLGIALLASAAFGQTTRLKAGYSTIAVGQSLVWVTKEAGIFKENGLDVELLFIGSSTLATQALIAGDVPFVIMSGATAINSSLAGSDLVMVTSTKKDPAQAYLVTAKEIREPSQLKARNLASAGSGRRQIFS